MMIGVTKEIHYIGMMKIPWKTDHLMKNIMDLPIKK